jgi:hypothetical protein
VATVSKSGSLSLLKLSGPVIGLHCDCFTVANHGKEQGQSLVLMRELTKHILEREHRKDKTFGEKCAVGRTLLTCILKQQIGRV